MFLRISGSSSMTNIFFIISSKHRKLDRHGCSFANSAVHLHRPAVQFGATFHQQQSETCTRPRPYIAAAMEGLEQLLLIGLRNPNAPIANDAHGVTTLPPNR